MASASFFLTVSAEKYAGNYRLNVPRCTKRHPGVGPNEVAIRLTLDLPDALFQAPQLSARVEISESSITTALDADVVNRIEHIAAAQNIHLTIQQPEEVGGEA